MICVIRHVTRVTAIGTEQYANAMLIIRVQIVEESLAQYEMAFIILDLSQKSFILLSF